MQHIQMTIPGKPLGKNDRYKIRIIGLKGSPVCPRCDRPLKQRSIMVHSVEFKTYAKKIAIQWIKQCKEQIRSGAWQITIRSYWPRQRHLDVDFALGDVDAAISGILDSLEYGEAIDDDIRFVRAIVEKYYDKTNPRVELEISQVPRTPEQQCIGT